MITDKWELYLKLTTIHYSLTTNLLSTNLKLKKLYNNKIWEL